MSNPIGVMQGRLLPKYQGRYQAHPVGYWQDEFPKAAAFGLDCIEFILDFDDAVHNPLLRPEGRQEIKNVISLTGVKVLSICADYFMEAPLHALDDRVAENSRLVLKQLVSAAADLAVRDVVIPCVDHSSIQDSHLRRRFQEALAGMLPEIERCNVNLALETDLNPSEFAELLTHLNSPRVTVNYDIGNSAALGYNPVEEFSAYGSRITDIHIKDRVLGGGSVKLGTGNADIPGFFRLVESSDYHGPLIMQAYRDDEGGSIFKEQLAWLKPYLGV